ncbi:MAG: ATP-binding cassette domain-containing protein, partial [Pirellulaceae bacterium]|nr:ATP-binding cassette domain-containing protein [Pirellulaceae bacterium]
MNTETVQASATESAAEIKGVCKTYKHFKLQNIHFSIERGSVAGLIGPNGAGKSTTMRILMGLVQPDAGSVSVLGQAISSSEASAKQDIGFFSD